MNGHRAAQRLIATKAGQVVKEPLRRVFTRLGYRLVPSADTDEARLTQLLRECGIDCVVDVGANQGQYALLLRSLGYDGVIESFEPGAEAFELLAKHAKRDSGWHCTRTALGASAGTAQLNVARNSVSSSLLLPLPAHVSAAPTSRIRSREDVEVVRLDEVNLHGSAQAIWLKLDTQGYELEVLKGAVTTLSRVRVVQSEVSLVPLYEGQSGILDMVRFLEEWGFGLVDVIPGFRDPRDGSLMQVDMVAKARKKAEIVDITKAGSSTGLEAIPRD